MRIAALALLPLLLAPAAAQEGPKTDDQKTLYALGMALGRNISVFELKPEEFAFVKQGLEDAVNSREAKVDLQVYGRKIDALAASRAGARAEKEKGKSMSFLDKAAKEKGAQKLPSGLIISDIKKGAGASPKATDKVRVHYRGAFIDGKEFDSSYKRGEPTEFPLNGVIPCWTEGLQRVKVGGKAKLVCPSSIAYGDDGRPGIPGGATLVFEVELLDILKS